MASIKAPRVAPLHRSRWKALTVAIFDLSIHKFPQVSHSNLPHTLTTACGCVACSANPGSRAGRGAASGAVIHLIVGRGVVHPIPRNRKKEFVVVDGLFVKSWVDGRQRLRDVGAPIGKHISVVVPMSSPAKWPLPSSMSLFRCVAFALNDVQALPDGGNQKPKVSPKVRRGFATARCPPGSCVPSIDHGLVVSVNI